jgi:hypothetical protein
VYASTSQTSADADGCSRPDASPGTARLIAACIPITTITAADIVIRIARRRVADRASLVWSASSSAIRATT